MIKKQWTPLALLLCLSYSVQAQKYEREARIRDSDMPAAALAYLAEAYPGRGRTRHYEEHSRHGQEEVLTLFYESKFKSQGYRYSVKFDSLGQLYDVERVIRFKQIPSPARQAIQQNLGGAFQHFRIEKIQERYAPDGELAGYEMEVRGKRDKELGYFELQYAPNGQRQSLEPIESDPNPFFFF